MGSAHPLKNGWKNKKRKHAKKSSFLCFCYILRAIRAGWCRERRYADHIFIQIYFRIHHFAFKFLKFSSPQAARGQWPPIENPADIPGRRRRKEKKNIRACSWSCVSLFDSRRSRLRRSCGSARKSGGTSSKSSYPTSDCISTNSTFWRRCASVSSLLAPLWGRA